MSNKQLDTKILKGMIFVLSVILCGFILYYAGKAAYRRIFRKSIRIEYYQNRLSAQVKRINTVIRSAQNTLEELSSILEFHKTTDAEQKILLKSVLFNKEELFGSRIAYEPNLYNKDSLYYSIYAHRQGDTILFSNLNDSEYNYFYKDWYLVPKTLKKPTWSEPYFDTGGGNTLITTYSTPVHRYIDNKEKFYGIATIDVSIGWLTTAIESYAKELNKYAILISENGTILSAPDEEMIFNETIFTVATERNLPVLRKIGRDLQQGKSGYEEINEVGKQKKWIAVYSTIEANKWGLILLIPEKEMFYGEISSAK